MKHIDLTINGRSAAGPALDLSHQNVHAPHRGLAVDPARRGIES
jgi:hypothetical protein